MSPNFFCHAFGQFRILRNISGPSSVVSENFKMVLKKSTFSMKKGILNYFEEIGFRGEVLSRNIIRISTL